MIRAAGYLRVSSAQQRAVPIARILLVTPARMAA